MVRYNELRVSPDGKALLVDLSVLPHSYYRNMWITEVRVDTEETFVAGEPSSLSVGVYTAGEGEENRRMSFALTADDLGLSTLEGHLFYVYAACGGAPSPDAPCGTDMVWTLGVTYDTRPVYAAGMKWMGEALNSKCQLPRGFVEFLLKRGEFELAMQGGHYALANELFLKWFGEIESSGTDTSSPCGCK